MVLLFYLPLFQTWTNLEQVMVPGAFHRLKVFGDTPGIDATIPILAIAFMIVNCSCILLKKARIITIVSTIVYKFSSCFSPREDLAEISRSR
ncbi:hypothetical protein GF325_12915 [Candidatus Bathyarchaeota archaeon]|nr:hypothetical protein [Candidatus Bathyarchaeota archaeon]